MKPSTLALLALTLQTNAHTQNFDGLYTGAEFGGVLTYANQTIQNHFNLVWSALEFNASSPYQQQSTALRTSATGTLLTGYGHSIHRAYLGGELGVNNGYYKMKNAMQTSLTRTVGYPMDILISNAETIISEVNLSPVQFQLFLKPGLFIKPDALLYGRIGTSFSTISTSNYFQGNKTISEYSQPPLVFPLNMQGKQSKNVASLSLGAGLEQQISSHIHLRMDYLFSYYGQIKLNNNAALNINDQNIIFNLSSSGYQVVSINQQSILLGLNYYW